MVAKYFVDSEGCFRKAEIGQINDPMFVRLDDFEQLERSFKVEVDRYEDLIKKIDNEKNELALKLGEIKKALLEVVRMSKATEVTEDTETSCSS
jgi:hypothetical protein